jgi:hypothetical protein
MPSNSRVSTDIDTFLRKATKEEAAAFLIGATYAPINNPTFTGTVGIATADFNVGSAGGEVSWNDTEKTLDLVTGSDDVTIQLGQETVLFARNNSGIQINDGECVMLTGSVGNKPAISKGDASNSTSAHKIIGIATQDISNNSEGYVTLVGKVRGINLPVADFSEGDLVYADPAVVGGLTTTKPDIEVELGIVLKTGGNGQIEVNINNEASIYDLEQELTRDVNVKDSVTITADKSPDENAVLEMVDKSTASNRRGALEKINGVLYVGPSDTQSERWKFQHEFDGKLSLTFPSNAGLRLGQGNSFLNYYAEGQFEPKLESGDGIVVQENYHIRQANYVRIGDLVQINVYISIRDFDTDWKTSTKNWRLTGLPFAAIGNHNIEIRPLRGWLDLGDNNITGSLAGGNNYLWFEEFVDGGTTAGQGNNVSRINANSFVTHPFNFSFGGTNAFQFIVTGAYKTDD